MQGIKASLLITVLDIILKLTIFRKFWTQIKKEFKNFAIKENGCHRSLLVLFETVVLCSDPERDSIKQVVLV